MWEAGLQEVDVKSGFHINYIDLLAIFHALKSFFRQKSDQHIRIHSDNSTAVAYISHMGGTHSKSMNYLTKCIWLWCIASNINYKKLSAIHIPGSDKEVADFYSRNFRENTEWSLRKDLFSLICDHFGVPDIDLFASRLNKQIKTMFPGAQTQMLWRPIHFHLIGGLFPLMDSHHFACFLRLWLKLELTLPEVFLLCLYGQLSPGSRPCFICWLQNL